MLRAKRAMRILEKRLIVVSLFVLLLLLASVQFATVTKAQSVSFFCLEIILGQDCTPPPAPVTIGPSDGAWRQSNDFLLSWQAVTDDESAVTYTVCASQSATFRPANCQSGLQETQINASKVIPDASSGSWFWRVNAMDESENTSDWTSRQLTIDAIDPVVTLQVDKDDIGGNQPTTHITGTAQDDNLESYQLLITNEGGTILETITMPEELDIIWDATERASGTYAVQLSARDKSGRVTIVTRQIKVDNSGPDITIAPGTLIKSGSIMPQVSVSDAHQSGLTYVWTADETNPGVISFDSSLAQPTFTPEVEGHYIFYLRVSDIFGNASTASFEFDLKRELETLPTPDPTNPAVVQENDKDAPDFTPPPQPVVVVSRAADSEAGDDGVLGETVSSILSGTDPVVDTAVVAATTDGWRIFGILWYWWLMVAVGMTAVVMWLRRRVLSRLAE